MHYKFVEIGCCDFNTQIDTLSDHERGLCVDAIEYYLDKLPSSSNLIKDNSAISNKNETVSLYYIPEYIILQYGLPIWLKGCNRIESIHPTSKLELERRNLPQSLIVSESIITKTYTDLILKHQCQSIDYLKIDTEGHEPAIIDSLYTFYSDDSFKHYNKPLKINIEAFTGILVEQSDIDKATEQLYSLGYKISTKNPPDIIFELTQ